MPTTTLLERARTAARFDSSPPHRQPRPGPWAAALAVSVVGSLLADALLVVIGEAVFPSTKGYDHFQFGDYAPLTIFGVVVACIAWLAVTRLTAAPRWVLLRLAVVVTVVLLLPDAAILTQGEPWRAVLFLVFMHLAIAVITYNALVRIAPPRRATA